MESGFLNGYILIKENILLMYIRWSIWYIILVLQIFRVVISTKWNHCLTNIFILLVSDYSFKYYYDTDNLYNGWIIELSHHPKSLLYQDYISKRIFLIIQIIYNHYFYLIIRRLILSISIHNVMVQITDGVLLFLKMVKTVPVAQFHLPFLAKSVVSSGTKIYCKDMLQRCSYPIAILVCNCYNVHYFSIDIRMYLYSIDNRSRA